MTTLSQIVGRIGHNPGIRLQTAQNFDLCAKVTPDLDRLPVNAILFVNDRDLGAFRA